MCGNTMIQSECSYWSTQKTLTWTFLTGAPLAPCVPDLQTEVREPLFWNSHEQGVCLLSPWWTHHRSSRLVGTGVKLLFLVANSVTLQSVLDYCPVTQTCHRLSDSYVTSCFQIVTLCLSHLLNSASFSLCGPEPLENRLVRWLVYSSRLSRAPQLFQAVNHRLI